MAFAVLHMQKISRSGLRGLQSHNTREKKSKTNPDIDYSRSDQNYELTGRAGIDYNKTVSEIIKTNAHKTKTVRKDAIVMCSFLITSDEKTMKAMSAETQRDFFNRAGVFLSQKYGTKNVINATVHMDETTPHMHIGIVPITSDGRLSAKSLFNPRSLAALQTEFAEQVGKPYGLERGVMGSERTRLSEQQFKAEMARQQAEQAAQKKDQAMSDAQLAASRAAQATTELNSLQRDIAESQERLRDLRQAEQEAVQASQNECDRAECLKGEISVLQEQLAAYQRTFYTVADIQAVGQKGIAGKVSMSEQDASRLKNQASAFFSAESRADTAEKNMARLKKYYADLEHEAPKLKRQIIHSLTSERDKIHDDFKVIRDILESNPWLSAAFNTQFNFLIKEQEKQAQQQQLALDYDLEID